MMRDKVRKHVVGYVHPPSREDYVVGTKPGKIIAAAVLRDDEVWTGKRHCDIIYEMAKARYRIPIRGDEQGFWTEDGWYIRRPAALGVAIENGQVKIEDLINKGVLTSEDLW
jgi:hypothetical protein